MYNRKASTEDQEELMGFLRQAGVSVEGVDKYVDYFILSEDDKGQLVGTIGMEPMGDIGLLRSFVISPKVSEVTIMSMFREVFKLAKSKELSRIYLATNKKMSIPFLKMVGFKESWKADVPDVLTQSEHGRYLVELDDAIFMELAL